MVFTIKSAYHRSPYYRSSYFGRAGFASADEMDQSVNLRNQLAARLIIDKAASEFTLNNTFTIQKSWLPFQELTLLNKDHPTGLLYLVAMPYDEENLSRSNRVKNIVSVLLGYQQGKIKYDDLASLDAIAEHVSEIKDRIRTYDIGSYSFSRIEAMRDAESGLPFGMDNLKQSGFFETYFVVHFNIIVP